VRGRPAHGSAGAATRCHTPAVGDEWDGEILGPGQGCSTVYATDGQQMLGGNNEDSGEPLTKVWFVPAEEGTFGMVFFGYGNYRAQGGMNDQGLFFDFLSVSKELPVLLEGKQPYTGTNFIVYDAMARCATVACVVEMFEKYYDERHGRCSTSLATPPGSRPLSSRRQSSANAAATRWRQLLPVHDRAGEAEACLPALQDRQRDAGGFPGPVRGVHARRDGGGPPGRRRSPTVYTNVYDLANRMVYLYYFFDYEHVVVIDLEEELAKGAHAYDLPALFPPNPVADEYNAPALRSYHNVIRSRRVEVDPAFLAAYVGEYAPAGVCRVRRANGSAWLRMAPRS